MAYPEKVKATITVGSRSTVLSVGRISGRGKNLYHAFLNAGFNVILNDEGKVYVAYDDIDEMIFATADSLKDASSRLRRIVRERGSLD